MNKYWSCIKFKLRNRRPYKCKKLAFESTIHTPYFSYVHLKAFWNGSWLDSNSENNIHFLNGTISFYLFLHHPSCSSIQLLWPVLVGSRRCTVLVQLETEMEIKPRDIHIKGYLEVQSSCYSVYIIKGGTMKHKKFVSS